MSLIKKLRNWFEPQCERCEKNLSQHIIEHVKIVGRGINFWGESVHHTEKRTEYVCGDCYNEYKRLEEIRDLELIACSEEFLNNRHYLSKDYVERRLLELRQGNN